MALRGNLKDFSLPDVFQLVQLSGKTGVLRIVRPDTEGSIWFRDGEVFFAQSNWRHDLLGERLVTAQRITPAALQRALDAHAAEGGTRRLGEILVSEGFITQQVLETFVQEQIQDTIFDIMRWDEGDFDFKVLPEVVHEDIGLSVSVENIVMEGSRRLEEWNRIKKKVPSTDMVFKMATAPGEGTFEISLKPVEWNLLLLIDGTRSVRDLAVEIHSTDFEVARVIYGLFSAGLLEVPSEEEVERLRAERAVREDKRATIEAARTERDQEQAADALSLEANLAAEAAARMAGSASEPDAEPTAVTEEDTPQAPEEAHATPEVPEFLAGGAGEAPSQDDMSVFAEMMEAVLTPHDEAPGAAPLAADDLADVETPLVSYAPSPEDEPYVATIDETAYAAPAIDETAYAAPAIDESGYPVLPGESAPPIEDVLAPDFGAISAADMSEIPAAPVADVLPAGDDFMPTGDFETDLRTLGLGEYPPELLEPVGETRLPMSEAEVEFQEAPPAPVDVDSSDAWAQLVETIAADEVVPDQPVDAGLEPAEADDLDSLLESLGGAPEQPTGVISSGTDFGAADEVPGEVISTDAFLAEFDTGSGLSGGLGDELTALTGGGSVRARPVATVNAIPEPGEGGKLHIDSMVDKDLLEKIIKGIEDL